MIIFPGETIPTKHLEPNADSKEQARCKLGQGILPLNNSVIAVRGGVLRPSKSAVKVQDVSKLYIPSVGDFVIGIILSKHSESFSVDIGATHAANLSMLAFEGASKRNRPNVLQGNVILGIVTSAYKEMEPEITCVYANGQANGLGVISSGLVVGGLSTGLCRYLSLKNCPLLSYVEKASERSFSLISASNNRLVVDGDDFSDVLRISTLVKNVNELFSQKFSCSDRLLGAPGDTSKEWLSVMSHINVLFKKD